MAAHGASAGWLLRICWASSRKKNGPRSGYLSPNWPEIHRLDFRHYFRFFGEIYCDAGDARFEFDVFDLGHVK